jgi:formate dehydrogenase major subunit
VTINTLTHESPERSTILEALRDEGIEVPTLCHDPRLAPLGGCRLCLVEIRGHPRPVTACTTLVAEGMEISTHTPQLERLRRTQLRLLARQYPKQSQNVPPSNEFLRWVRKYGLDNQLGAVECLPLIDDSHRSIHVDMSRCIHCFRCVRICDEVAGRDVWRAWNRGDRTEIKPVSGAALGDSNCVSCGACVDACPSGALRDRCALDGKAPTDEVRTVCPYCGVGCEMQVGRRDGRVTSIRPVIDAPVNKGHLCVKGRYGWNFVHAPDRMTRPMIRRGDAWQPVTWSAAIEYVAHRLQKIMAADGPDAIGMLGSSRATNEENYLTQKFARVVIGTNNVDCCARVCHAPTAVGMKLMLGAGAATNSFDDIEQARTIMVCGANPTENHPVVGDRIRQAVRRGAELIVIDPRRIELAECARVHLQLRPGSNIPLLNAMAHTIVAERLFDPTAQEQLSNWDEFQRFIAHYSPDQLARDCGVDAESIRCAARLYATRRPAMCFHGLGLTEHVQGTEGVMCLVNLALLTGNIGCPGAGVNPLRGQNNVQGAAHMGCDPDLLPGSAPVTEHRQRFEVAWKAPLPMRSGLNLMQMMDAARSEKLKALWVIGYDIALTNPNAATTIAALRSLDLVVVQDLFLTETARLAAHVYLPACSTFEKDGTFMNSERRIQRVRQVIEPIGESLPDWKIICRLAEAMGKGNRFQYSSSQEIWDETRSLWPAGAGIAYERLDDAGLQWPCPTEDSPGTSVMHSQIFSNGRRLKLQCVKFAPSPECMSEEYPLLLNTGRALYQFNAGNMTSRSQTSVFQPMDVLQISPGDAERFGIQDAEQVRIVSRYGEATLAAEVTQNVRTGELFATFQSPELFLNRVTSRRRDSFTLTPEYKTTAVRIEPVGSRHSDMCQHGT